MADAFCDRTGHCLNFRHAHETSCSGCGKPIETNHFHSQAGRYRLCHVCFERNIDDIIANRYTTQDTTDGERPECMRALQCSTPIPFTLFVPKLCNDCGQYPVDHYHDICRNLRFCIDCYLKRRKKVRDNIDSLADDRHDSHLRRHV
jgi:hypothetical protein